MAGRAELHVIALRTGVRGAVEKTASDRDCLASSEAVAGRREHFA